MKKTTHHIYGSKIVLLDGIAKIGYLEEVGYDPCHYQTMDDTLTEWLNPWLEEVFPEELITWDATRFVHSSEYELVDKDSGEFYYIPIKFELTLKGNLILTFDEYKVTFNDEFLESLLGEMYNKIFLKSDDEKIDFMIDFNKVNKDEIKKLCENCQKVEYKLFHELESELKEIAQKNDVVFFQFDPIAETQVYSKTKLEQAIESFPQKRGLDHLSTNELLSKCNI